ncbi:1-phosphofructokinase family hexose kinase [Pseudorhodobacter sp. MZDSW-24AT]|uniref:1-phosphofructokinase family hexose kinase n=1 Tax=Pseudorhodobacter sp. MZDSW-24AT TaxID=2052957 RepID=UPI000C1E3036|nr:1-phosphofructokinase family hexose kinase [Pseudorhodobacter sp. MZDSW-24AT]PJF09440.1 sugar kinase [Pseudorhodobacter sp. MZDSW-24AT]
MQAPILTLTLNPALDMATEVPEILPGQKLRCTDPHLDPGGGGLNVSRAIKALGGDSLALVALGGLTGDRLAGLIRAEGVTFLSILGPGETRQSLTVTEGTTGKQFRFMLPGPLWGAAERARVFTLLAATARPGGYGVISGSQPPGVPADFPAALAASMEGTRVVLDTSGAALTAAVDAPIPGLEVLRMDGEEGEALAGRRLETLAETADFAADLVARGVARRVIVARGAEGNVLAEAGRRLFSPAPRVRVVSTVGAGDSFVAAFVLALARGQDAAEALTLGSAAAAAAVTTDATQLCRATDVARLLPEATARAL